MIQRHVQTLVGISVSIENALRILHLLTQVSWHVCPLPTTIVLRRLPSPQPSFTLPRWTVPQDLTLYRELMMPVTLQLFVAGHRQILQLLMLLIRSLLLYPAVPSCKMALPLQTLYE